VSAPYFLVQDLAGDRAALSSEDSRHALRSLRLRPGDAITLTDGQGAVAEGRLVGEEQGVATVSVLTRRNVVRPRPRVAVAMAPPKGDRLAWAVQKLAELGTDATLLLRTDRSVRAWGETRVERARERLLSVSREASMQSRRAFVMEVAPPVSLEQALDGAGPEAVVLWEGAEAPLADSLPDRAEQVMVVVGPEGGFSDLEVASMRERGCTLASVGPGILRTETAAVVGATLVLARYGRLG
jgi:16S rRNA (uracil1498-N3)-methyltransferase